MTGIYRNVSKLDAMREHGIVDYLIKPFGVEKVCSLAAAHLKATVDDDEATSPRPELESLELDVEDPDVCLARLYRLLRPGGTICFHEYSVADSTWSRAVWNAVTLGVVIPSGRILSGSARIYRYLRRSVNEFDGAGAFERRLGRAGYVGIRTERMDGWQRGIVHSFLARRPE